MEKVEEERGVEIVAGLGEAKEAKEAPTRPRPQSEAPLEEWAGLAKAGDWDALRQALLDYWAWAVPAVFPPAHSPTAAHQRAEELDAVLLGPLESFVTAGSSLAALSASLGGGARRQGQICGKVFRSGELTYTCSDCATDGTCVMCGDCFQASPHKDHSYKMHASGGSGYCDCGDEEAWSAGHVCRLHDPQAEASGADQTELPDALRLRLENVFRLVLRYVCDLLVWEGTEDMPCLVPTPPATHPSMPAQVILFNDEHHTYDIVIEALEQATKCATEDAQLLASIVDKDGRAPVYAAAVLKCTTVRDIIRKKSKQNSLRPAQKDSLKVEVLDSALVAHQAFALRLLTWTTEAAKALPALLPLLAGQIMEAGPDGAESAAARMLHADAGLWKAARSGWHNLLMATVLMDMDSKVAFGRLFIRSYDGLMRDFVADDHEHSLSAVAMAVQVLTVPTIARTLVAEEDALAVVCRTFLRHFRNLIGSEAHCLAFGTESFTLDHKRAMFAATDAKYLLGAPPPAVGAAEWADGRLRRGFVDGVHALLAFLDCVQGMDKVKRQTTAHIEWEPEWESAFNIQLRLQHLMACLLVWTDSSAGLLTPCLAEVLRLLQPRLAAMPTELVAVADNSVVCVDWDVASQPVSIHLPLTRLLPSFLLALEGQEKTLEELGPEGRVCWTSLMEEPLRVLVLGAQINANMWRRNGYAVLNQLHNYMSPICRVDMFDRDLGLLQICAAKMEPEELLVRLLAKFGLRDWVRRASKAEPKAKADEKEEKDEAEQKSLIESFLHLLVLLLGERWRIGVGVGVDPAAEVRQELVGLLCRGPKPFSKIERTLPDGPRFARLNLEELCREVADFVQPTATTAGRFELKVAMRKHFNPFFYHYSRTDVSAVNEYLFKDCKGEGVAWGPSTELPVFTPLFRPLLRLLRSRLFVKLVHICVEGALDKASESNLYPGATRTFSDGQLHRSLWLLSLGLLEEGRDGAAEPKLSAIVREVGLDKAIGRLDEPNHAALIQGLRGQLADALDGGQSRRKEMETETSPPKGDEERRAWRAKKAAANRASALAAMASMQQRFMKTNSHFLGSGEASSAGEGEEDEDDDEERCRLGQPDSFPVALGPRRSALEPPSLRRLTCILCSESAVLGVEGPPFVYAGFVQASAVFAEGGSAEEGAAWEKRLLASAHLALGTHVSTCGHALHLSCYEDYLRKEQSRADASRRRTVGDVKNGEYSCPLCKRLSNIVLPILPTLHALAAASRRPQRTPGEASSDSDMEWEEAGEPEMDFTAWLDNLRTKVLVDPSGFLAAASSVKPSSGPRKLRSSSRLRALKRVEAGGSAEGREDSSDSDQMDDEDEGGTIPVEAPGARISLASAAGSRLALFQGFLRKHLTSGPLPTPLRKFHQVLSQLSIDLYDRGAGFLADTVQSTRDMTEPLQSHGIPSQALAYTLRSTAHLLRFEGKPLFGAHSSRTKAGLEALSRSVVAVQLFNAKGRRELRSALLSQLKALLHPTKKDERLPHQLDALSLTLGLVLSVRSCETPELRKDWSDVVEPRWGQAELFALRLGLSLHLYQTLLHALLHRPAEPAKPSKTSCEPLVTAYSCLRALLPERLRPQSSVEGRDWVGLEDLVSRSVQEFLAPLALFVHAATLTPPPEALKDPAISALVPLCRYLGLPDQLGALVYAQHVPDLWALWAGDEAALERSLASQGLRAFPVAPRDLVELPEEFSSLVRWAGEFQCPSLAGKTDEERREATMCLVCGRLVCSHSYCCQRPLRAEGAEGAKPRLVGGCTYHGHFCSAQTGVFLRVRESQMVLQWRAERGVHLPSPYVDQFGETDPGFRRGKPLHLNRDLYRRIRLSWLAHSVPEDIAARTEADHRHLLFDWHHI